MSVKNAASPQSFVIAASGMECWYQPIYHVGKKRITEVEILLRVSDGDAGFFDTEHYVQQAEQSGDLGQIDWWMFCQACHAFPELNRYGIEKININLSPSTCMEPGLARKVGTALITGGVRPGQICMEVSESAGLPDETSFLQTVRELYDIGISIAIDDFGKGYSGLLRLLRMPFHVIKLDKELVWAMDNQRLAKPRVRNIIDFAGANHFQVTAEGVETIRTARSLAEMGCHYLQGYLISRPLPFEELLLFLNQEGKRIL